MIRICKLTNWFLFAAVLVLLCLRVDVHSATYAAACTWHMLMGFQHTGSTCQHTTWVGAAEVLAEQLKPSMSVWMADCFEVAAAGRFEALSIACDRAVRGGTGRLHLHVLPETRDAYYDITIYITQAPT